MATEVAPAPAPAPADRIQGALEDLEAEKTLITNCTQLWRALSGRFSSLDRALADRSCSLVSKLEALDDHALHTLASLDAREASLPARESAAAALTEDRRRSALQEIEDPDSKPPRDLPSLLRWYGRRMDAAGLWRLMVLRRKDLAVLRREVSDAVGAALDPARLVLDAVDDFVGNPSPAPAGGGGGDRCWALGMLLRVLYDLEEGKKPEVAASVAERAAVVAEAWRAKAEEKGGGGMGGSEAQMLLQMVVAFGLQSRFEQDDLKKLVLKHASRKEMPKLAAGLGFGEKLTDVVDELVKTGKELEAVHFAYESGLTERFSPVSLLKSHLQNTKKNANAILKNGSHSNSAKEESANLELNALRSTIKCVETYKLEPMFGLDGLRKRVAQLEKAKADKKKTAAANKSQMKRTRPSGMAPAFRPSKATRTNNTSYPSFHRNPPQAYQAPVARHSYNYPGQGGFDGSAPPSYGISAHNRSPAQISQQYYVPEYGGPSLGYGGYDYAAPAQQPPYPR